MSIADVGVGLDVAFGFGIETTPGTRVAPDTFCYITQESLSRNQEFIRNPGLGGGRQILRSKKVGAYNPGGDVSMVFGTAEAANILRWVLGGNPSASGSDPYTRAFAGLGDLPSATLQKVVPYGGGSQPFDFLGAYCASATFEQSAGEYLSLRASTLAYDVVTDQTAATFAPPSDEQLLTFQDVAVTIRGGSAECFDSFDLTIDNGISGTTKTCAADAGRPSIRQSGMRSVTGTLRDDFKDMNRYNDMVAGTEGALVFTYTGENSSSLTISLNVFFTSETPQVSGPGEVKQGVPFEVLHPTADASAITFTLVNGES